jgi:hypothetical protein
VSLTVNPRFSKWADDAVQVPRLRLLILIGSAVRNRAGLVRRDCISVLKNISRTCVLIIVFYEISVKTLIVMLAASAPIFEQSTVSPVLPDHSATPNAVAIVGPSIAATERSWKARAHYTYTQRAEDRRLDSDGRVKSEEVDVSTITSIDGVPVEQPVEHNGLPPPVAEQRKYQEKVRKVKRETPAERTARLQAEENENTSLIHEIPLAFDFLLVGEESIDGRPAYILLATPHPGYSPRGKYGRMFSRVEGKLWVDKQDFGWVKVDAHVIEPLSMGLFLARVLPGSRVTMEQLRVGEGMWMPRHIEARANAKILLIKTLAIDKELTYTDYQPAQNGIDLPLRRGPQ